MGLKDRVAQKQASRLAPSERVVLPDLGEEVVVRCLTAGALLRANALPPETQGLGIIAFATEDPERSGEPLWNWGDIGDRKQIEALSSADFRAIIAAHNRLTGEGEDGGEMLGKSGPQESGSTFSPPGSVSPQENLGTG